MAKVILSGETGEAMSKIMFVLLGIGFSLLPMTSDARSTATHQTSKNFRELIVRGERPEITACMVASLNYVRNDAKYNALRWTDDDSETAVMQEFESDTHLLRSVSFNAQLRLRDQGLFTGTWKTFKVSCEQRDENSPEVRIDETFR